MKYLKTITLKNGKEAILRNGTASDGAKLLEVFNKTHAETEFLLTYPEEGTFTVEIEEKFLSQAEESEKEIELMAIVDGEIIGSAGFYPVDNKIKLKHRADFGISVLKEYWGLGIGKELTLACIECAKKAGFDSLELQAVTENEAAIKLYEKVGFKEYGRYERGFKKKDGNYQELIFMSLDL